MASPRGGGVTQGDRPSVGGGCIVARPLEDSTLGGTQQGEGSWDRRESWRGRGGP